MNLSHQNHRPFTSPRRKQGHFDFSTAKPYLARAAGWLLVLILALGSLTSADDPPPADALAVESSASKDGNVRTSDPVNPQMPDISGIWRIGPQDANGIREIRKSMKGEDFDFRMIIEGAPDSTLLKWSGEHQQFEADVPGSDGPLKLLVKPRSDGNLLRGLVVLNDDATKFLNYEWTRVEIPSGSGGSALLGNKRVEEFDDILLLETPNGLSAYNEKSAHWRHLNVGLPKDGKSRISHATHSRHFAVALVDDHLLAFSSKTDRWSNFKIPPADLTSVTTFFRGNRLSIQVGDKRYDLSTETGDWKEAKPKIDSNAAAESKLPDDVSIPNIAGKWSMGKKGEFGPQEIRFVPDNPEFPFEYETADKAKVSLQWNANRQQFVGIASSPQGKGKVVLKPMDNGRKLQFSLTPLDAASKAAIEQAARDNKISETDMANLLNHEWTLIGKSRGQTATVKSGPQQPSPDGQAEAPDANSSPQDRLLSELAGNWQMKFRLWQIRRINGDWFLLKRELQNGIQNVTQFPIQRLPEDQAFRVDLPWNIQEPIPYRMTYSPQEKIITLVPILDESLQKKILTFVNQPDKSTAQLEKELTQVMTRNVLDRIAGENCLIVETKDGLDGYSQIRGVWDRIQIGMPQDGFPRISNMTVSERFASVIIDDQLLGFSSEAGKWGRLTIPPEHVGNVKVEHGKIITARVGDQTYALSPQTGQWTTPDGRPTSVTETGETNTSTTRVVPIKNREQIDDMLRKLIRYYGRLATFGRDKDAIVVSGNDPYYLAKIEEAIRQYDDKLSAEPTPVNRESSSVFGPDPIRSPSPATQRLADEIARHEAEAVELAKQIRNRSEQFGKNHPQQTEARQQMQNALAAALDLKFQLEKLQVDELRTRLSRLEQQIGQRQALKQKIIDRRAEELIEGDPTRWETPATFPSTEKSEPEERRVGRGSASPTKSASSAVGLEESSHPTTTIAANHTEIAFRGPEGMRVKFFHENGETELPVPANYAFPRGESGTTRTYDVSFVYDGWKAPMPATLEIYPADEKTEAFLSHNKIQINFGVHVLGMIGARKPLDIVAFLPAVKSQELAAEMATSYVTSAENPQYNLVEMAKSQGTVLAVLRLPKNRDEFLQERKAGSGPASPTDSAPPVAGLEESSRPTAQDEFPIPSYQDLAKELRQAQDIVASARRDIAIKEKEHLPGLVDDRKFLEEAIHNQEMLLLEYRAILRDLELQAESEQLAVADAQAKLDRAEQLFEKRIMTEHERNDIARQLKQAQLTQERLQNRLDLYRKTVEQNGLVVPKLSSMPLFSEGSTDDLATAEKLAGDRLGLKLRSLKSSEQTLTEPRYRGGLVVTEVKADSPAAVSGIRENDILVGLGKWETVALQNVSFVLKQARNDQRLKFYVLRDREVLHGEVQFLTVK